MLLNGISQKHVEKRTQIDYELNIGHVHKNSMSIMQRATVKLNTARHRLLFREILGLFVRRLKVCQTAPLELKIAFYAFVTHFSQVLIFN